MNDNTSDFGEFPPVAEIKIWAAHVTGGDTPEYIGQRVFFVDLIFQDGSAYGMWDGLSYDEAIIAAGECAEGQYPVHDDVVVGPLH